jgi:hypothetical protein
MSRDQDQKPSSCLSLSILSGWLPACVQEASGPQEGWHFAAASPDRPVLYPILAGDLALVQDPTGPSPDGGEMQPLVDF